MPITFRTVAVIRHLAFEDLGLFAPVLARTQATVTYYEAGVDDLVAPMREADLTIVLGGPIGVYEADHYPFLNDELAALKDRLAAGRPTLGICLGAQLMAAALGARVYPGGRKELGWGELSLTEAGRAACLGHLASTPVLHWHGDTFDLPAGATLLASTEVYPNQAFAVGKHALALQFHVEADYRRIEQWLIGHTGELSGAGIDIPTLRAASHAAGPRLAAAAPAVLNQWLVALPG